MSTGTITEDIKALWKKYRVTLRKENTVVKHQTYGTSKELTPEQFAGLVVCDTPRQAEQLCLRNESAFRERWGADVRHIGVFSYRDHEILEIVDATKNSNIPVTYFSESHLSGAEHWAELSTKKLVAV